MIAEHEAVVAARFDALHGRFKREVAADDPRLRGDRRAAWAAGRPPRSRPGLRQGPVCQGAWRAGRAVVGLDLSAAMLAEATGVDRVRASARRLPFRPGELRRRSMAVEVFEHLAPESLDHVCGEVRRVLRPGGTLVDRRQERVLVECPAALAAERGREVDRRAPRPLDVFAPRDRCASAGSGQRELQAAARPVVSRRSGSSTCCREPKQGRFPFQ